MTTEEQRVAEQKAAEQDRLAHEERLAQQERWSDAAIDREPVIGRRGMRRLLWVGVAVVIAALLVTLPPLLNISRYQHRVASSISGSIGRPVRFDNISLRMLPFPGFTIENFVVYEDPSFGAEPAMRANRVDARIRLLSLWRRRVEVSHITLESPTVNLVRNAAGYWNMQGVVTQAAQVQSAPTAQAKAGDAPRFPYIEGSDARVNVKLDETKLPYAVVDTEFALWLPNEREWHLRMAGRPLRSDTDASDVGHLSMEATLSRHGANTAQSPFTMEAEWKPTPLGEASKLVVGKDTGWRGMASAEATVNGTPGNMHVAMDTHVHDLRRAEFVPAESMQMDVHCEGNVLRMGRELMGVHCTMPTGTTSLLEALSFRRNGAAAGQGAPDVLHVEAEVPDTLNLRRAKVNAALEGASPAWGLRWLRLLSRRMSPATAVGGVFSMSASNKPDEGWTGSVICRCVLPVHAEGGGRGRATAEERWAVLINHSPKADEEAQVEVDVRAETAADAEAAGAEAARTVAKPAVTGTLSMQESSLNYTSVKLAREFAAVIPALADNLPGGFIGPGVAHRVWGERQVWTGATSQPGPGRKRHRTRR